MASRGTAACGALYRRCPDLRGYGKSSKPLTTDDHEPYSKRAMARDGVSLMRALGHERFIVAGHDRGSYVASRLALDHPERVSALVVMEGVPIAEALARCDAAFARSWYHWFFLALPAPLPERVILADPDVWYGGNAHDMGAEAFDDIWLARRDSATVHAMCEDYRAGLGIDRQHDEVDRNAGRRIECATLCLPAAFDDLARLYDDPLAVWRPWAPNVIGGALPCGHHKAEEAPEALVRELVAF